MASQLWLVCLTIIVAVECSHASGVTEDLLQRRAPTQSEQAVNGGRGNITIAIAAASGVAGTILLTLM